ncbi:hypothetical protein DTO169E5_6429 [Paecilomyces variotii]|nr:hypothetical protein DTO169E5_6429 [Paecilomyces variotii]KAJ9353503.1 hypothetical protein DTO027B9_5205 [Paecilomyces variotii]
MKTPPLPSPAKAPSPVAASHTHLRRPSRQDLESPAVSNLDGPVAGAQDVRSPLAYRQDMNVSTPMLEQDFDSRIDGPDRVADKKKQDTDARTLEELRRRMEETLVYQQSLQKSYTFSNRDLSSPESSERKSGGSSPTSPSRALPSSDAQSSNSYADSVGSSNTVRATTPFKTPKECPTPSYPFPVMNDREAHLQEPFTLVFPGSNLKSRSKKGETAAPLTSVPRNVFLPPGATTVAEDPSYPSPSLYDVTLKLNSDPGLDAWWTNVVDILQTHYGAERATLAVPGDLTDLENIPWGQKATFNPDGVHQEDSNPVPEPSVDPRSASATLSQVESIKKQEDSVSPLKMKAVGSGSTAKRPPLAARHSFAGFGKDGKTTVSRDFERPRAASRAHSSLARAPAHGNGTDDKSLGGAEVPGTQPYQPRDSPVTQNSPLVVFPIPRALEVEPDPLIKRTGVVRLFGRTKPAVLTREYAHDPAGSPRSQGESIPQTPDDKDQTTPAAEPPRDVPKTPTRSTHPRPGAGSSLNPHAALHSKNAHLRGNSLSFLYPDDVYRHTELYEEYEQAPPSPWSQSPAPSPAPKLHPEQNPFFSTHTVDEEAFAQNPPKHDYSKVEPLEAIGVEERSKSVVHIPLLHTTSSKQESPMTLRFPVAIISFLSPIVPYPANLRQSLTYLMPHLTASFCLAQQYSQLERQISVGPENPRYGHLLGLGGTFSDASSELELVAGLSGHVNYALTDEGSLSARASLSTPDDGLTKISPAMSTSGTPAFELNNSMSADGSNFTSSSVPKQSNETIDSYFNIVQTNSPQGAPPTQSRSKPARSKQNISSSPTSPVRARARSGGGVELLAPHDTGLPSLSNALDVRPPPGVAAPSATSRNQSTNSLMAQLQRDIQRPFPDTIAQLMLNSVPLHLFLAKPQSGEVIWTNAKFDAYRRSQPHEQRVRDPWQNIHSSEREHISKEWQKALRTGSQFTERVRVKRFNDEAAYRWFIFRANPLLSGTGELLYWIGSFLDIHEQHIAELKATQERERFATDAKYRALANSIPQVVFEAAEHRGLISANEQWHLYTGQKIEDAMNLGFTKHIHPDDLEKCGIIALDQPDLQKRVAGTSESASTDEDVDTDKSTNHRFARGVTPALDELVRRGVVQVQKDENGRVFYSTEIRLRSKGGDFRWHLVRLVKVETNFGNREASWYGTCTDINDRKLLERELNKAMQQLNKEMESKTKFFSNMSHEIRTPLNGILGTIPFILDTQLDNDQRRMLDTIQNSSTNLRELVDNILDVSRVEAGKMSLVNAWFHVRSVVEDVIDTIASRAIDKGLEINYLMDVDVPAMVIGDRFRIRQVLINLMGNAVKFTSSGEIYTRCSIYRDPSVPLRSSEILLYFEVVDTGKGFSAADAERLMQRFSQIGGSGSQQHAGSGLGLFLSKQLVEMHGGKLTPSSREGQGAKFSFYVKVDAPPPPTQDEPPLTRQSSSLSEAPTAVSNSSPKQRIPLLSKDSGDSKTDLQELSPTHEAPMKSPGITVTNHQSEGSSAVQTPELQALEPPIKMDGTPKEGILDSSESSGRERTRSLASTSGDTIRPTPSSWMESTLLKNETRDSSSGSPLPASYSVMIICPLDNAREAARQHIEQVIPHEIPSTITTLPDVEDWKDLVNAGDCPSLTHLVLSLPSVEDVFEVMQYVLQGEKDDVPAIVIMSDLYQKRQINSKIEELIAADRKVYTVPKPVKPSAFSSIFDPENRRDLSKDRNQDMAREINNNFKTMSKIVKEVIGNKGYRILLVEDDETNRMVMLKYLDKIKVVSETAGNGEECTELVFSKEPGYYSLIICDIQMPVKNGYDTCREIRAWEQKNHFPQIPIMALSANAMTDQIDDAARAGFNDYVTKPIKHNELGKMMMGLLDPSTPQVLLRDRRRTRHDIQRST